MIGRITGTLIEKNPPHLLVDCHGIGYETDVPMGAFYSLPATGEKVVLLTQQIVREGVHLFYGFGTTTEHKTFRRLIKILGIGARTALAVPSDMSVARLAQVITLRKTEWLTCIPGIDEKTAKRLLPEFRGKLGADLGMAPDGPAASDDAVDVLNILLALGYSDKETALAIKQVPTDTGVFKGIRLALKTLSEGWRPSATRRQNGLFVPFRCRLPVMVETNRLAVKAISAERTISTPPASPNEGAFKRVLRPKLLDGYVGQEKVRGQFDIFMTAAKSHSEALNHMLLSDPPGLGKTTPTHTIVREMGVNLRQTSGLVLKHPDDLAALLTNLEANDTLLIDKIHRLSPVVEEILYPVLEDYQIDIMIGEDSAARSVEFDLQPSTLVDTITHAGTLTNSLHDRSGTVAQLEFYTPAEPAKIVTRSLGLPNTHIVNEGALGIARRSYGMPRTTNRLLRRTRDPAEVKADGIITHEVTDAALAMFDVDTVGFDLMDRKLLEAILHKFSGGPVGIDNLVITISEEHDTIEDVLEPYLIR